MATIPSFYDNNWTVLQKLKYLEFFMKNNNIDWNTVVWTMNEDGTYTIKGKNFIGEEITIADKLSLPEIEGRPALVISHSIPISYIPNVGEEILIQDNAFNRMPVVGDAFTALFVYGEKIYICILEVKKLVTDGDTQFAECNINDVELISTAVTIADIVNLIEGSDYISFDLNMQDNKLVIALDKTKVDETVKEDSDNLIISGAVFDALSNKADTSSVTALQQSKQDKLTNGSITSDLIASHAVTDDKLSTTTVNKINKSLKTPATNPTEFELVGIDTNNSQKNIEIGDGLKVENDHLKAKVAFTIDGTTLNITDN